MRRAPRAGPAFCVLVVCLALGLSAQPGPPPPPPYPTRANPTVEPLPPVSLELQFSDRLEWGAGGTAVLQSDVVSGADVEELSVRLDLPEGLELSGGAAGMPAREGRLRPGERRTRRLPVAASGDGVFPVRLEADVRLVDGRTFRVSQGATLRIGRPRPEGRLHNGAYEIRGVSMSAIPR